MTEVQIWSIVAGALVAAVLITAIALRRRQKRAHPHGHIVVDMTVPRANSVAAGQGSDEVTKDRASGGSDLKGV